MLKKQIAKTNILASEIILGTFAIGGTRWGDDVNDKDSTAVIEKALELGINTIDLAPIYGFGHAEELVGKIIKNKRENIVLATKCGLVWDDKQKTSKDLSAKNIEREINISLKRLNTDYIDIYFTHWPDANTPLQETYSKLQELKDSGKIKAIGACNVDIISIEQINKICELSVVQNKYSILLDAGEKEAFEYCKEKGISFWAYGSLAGGILSGKYKDAPSFAEGDVRNSLYKNYYGDNFSKSSEIIKKLEATAEKNKKPISAAAINWILSQGGTAFAICGAKRPAQIEENASASGWE